MNKNLIATSGCFEILHADHINLLYKMSLFKKEVYVFLNSDYSYRLVRHKEPLINDLKRQQVLEAIQYVTKVIVMNSDHPHSLIRKYEPSIWAKGGDYDIEKMQSTPIVRAYGGEVITIPHKYGVHATDILEKYYKSKINCNLGNASEE